MPKLANLKFITPRLATKALLIICLLTGLGIVIWPNGHSTVKTVAGEAKSNSAAKAEQSPVDNQPANNPSIQATTSNQGSTPTSSGQTKSSTNQLSEVQTQTPAEAPSFVTASLLVNGVALGSMNIPAGSTQCELLNQAKSNGLIKQLTITYISAFKSYGVYKINDQGDDNKVWWVYEVNGKSPPAGCSGVTVENGDSVNWKYLK